MLTSGRGLGQQAARVGGGLEPGSAGAQGLGPGLHRPLLLQELLLLPLQILLLDQLPADLLLLLAHAVLLRLQSAEEGLVRWISRWPQYSYYKLDFLELIY